MAITYGIKVFFGTPSTAERPALPPGWHAVYGDNQFATAFSPHGEEYYLGPKSVWKIGRSTREQVEAGCFATTDERHISSHEIPIADLA